MYPIQRQEGWQQHAAEWCELDDIVRHTEIGGQNVAIRVAVAGLTERETMRDWARHSGANVRIVAAPVAGAIGILVIGPPCKWHVTRIVGNHGYTLYSDDPEYAPGQSVIFTLHAGGGAL